MPKKLFLGGILLKMRLIRGTNLTLGPNPICHLLLWYCHSCAQYWNPSATFKAALMAVDMPNTPQPSVKHVLGVLKGFWRKNSWKGQFIFSLPSLTPSPPPFSNLLLTCKFRLFLGLKTCRNILLLLLKGYCLNIPRRLQTSQTLVRKAAKFA